MSRYKRKILFICHVYQNKIAEYCEKGKINIARIGLGNCFLLFFISNKNILRSLNQQKKANRTFDFLHNQFYYWVKMVENNKKKNY